MHFTILTGELRWPRLLFAPDVILPINFTGGAADINNGARSLNGGAVMSKMNAISG
ncbi:MAG: hypothetical protein ACOY90_12170 [Candidatus Zhuqueibacterota bacterium]